jgi:hypothetical protein
MNQFIKKITGYANALNSKFDMEVTGYAIQDLGNGLVRIGDDQEAVTYNAKVAADAIDVNNLDEWDALWYALWGKEI